MSDSLPGSVNGDRNSEGAMDPVRRWFIYTWPCKPGNGHLTDRQWRRYVKKLERWMKNGGSW